MICGDVVMGIIDPNLTAQSNVVYDTEEAARYLGCSASYLKKLRQISGGPDFTRIGIRKGVNYRRCDLDRWLEARRFGSTTDYPETLP